VIAGGALADPEPQTDGAVVEALCDQLENLMLARRGIPRRVQRTNRLGVLRRQDTRSAPHSIRLNELQNAFAIPVESVSYGSAKGLDIHKPPLP
jgi:hypothetical protein